MTAFTKAVSGLERLFIVYNDARPPFVNQFVVEGTGALTEADLFEALDATTAVNPGSTLVLTPDHNHWVEGPAPSLWVLDLPSVQDGAEFLRDKLDPYQGPTCEIVLVKGRDKTSLVFRSLHATMDGQGTLLWAKDFMRCLRGEDPVGNTSAITLDGLLRSIAKGVTRDLPPIDALHPFGKVRWFNRTGSYRWARITVDRPMQPGMLARIAVRLAERARKRCPGPVRFNIPTDNRHLCEDERSTGNLLAGLITDVSEDMTPHQLSMEIVRQIYHKKNAQPLKIHGALGQIPLGTLRLGINNDLVTEHNRGTYRFSGMLSHLGVLSGRDYSAPGFESSSAFFVPPYAEWACYVAMNGFDGHIEATVGLPITYTRKKELDAFVGLVTEALQDEPAAR